MLPATNGAWFLGSVKKYRMFYLIINVKKKYFHCDYKSKIYIYNVNMMTFSLKYELVTVIKV